MTLAERKTNPAITNMLAEVLTESEMEQATGGKTHPVDGIINLVSWIACGFNHHYKYTGKKQTRLDLLWHVTFYERKCQDCGHYDWTRTPPEL